jgi:methionine-rich copper-binding protein CopC
MSSLSRLRRRWRLGAAVFPASLAGLLVFSLSRVALAAPCGRPDVDITFPPDAATAVPIDAVLAAHYGSPARYDDEPVTLTDAAGSPVSVTSSYDAADSMLRAVPDQPLSAGLYTIAWPSLRGVSSSGGLGRGKSVSFTVQSSADLAPPSFPGLVGIEWDLARDRDPCLDRLDDRFVFKLEVGEALEDTGSSLLALLVFETRDPTAPQQTEPSRVAVKAWPANGVVEVRRPANKAGQTCFAAVAQDLVGSVSGGGDKEVCVKTKKPPFFEGCALVAPGKPRAPSGFGYALLLLGLAWLTRGRTTHARPARAD